MSMITPKYTTDTALQELAASNPARQNAINKVLGEMGFVGRSYIEDNGSRSVAVFNVSALTRPQLPPAPLAFVTGVPTARPPIAAPAIEAAEPRVPTQRPETGGTTERVFRPGKLGLPAGSEAEKNVIRTFEALGLDTRKIRTFDDMRLAAQEFGIDPEALLSGAAKRPLTDMEVVSLRNLLNSEATNAAEATAAVQRGGLSEVEHGAAERSAALSHERIKQALKRLSIGGTETGRAVAAFRIIGQRTLDPAYWYRTAQRELRGREFTPEIREAIDELVSGQDRLGLARLMASLHNSTKTEKAITLWKAGLLTSPGTDVANITGNVFMAAMETLKDIPATAFDALASVATGQRTKTLSPRVLGEKIKGFGIGAGKAVEYLRKGDVAQDLLTKYDFNRGTRFDTPALQFYTQAVFRRLGAEDVLFREPALRASVAEQAIVEARNLELAGRRFLEHVRERIKAPTPKMLEIAQNDASYATFQQENPVASWLGKARGPTRVGVELVMPFRRTPLNIANAILDYSPFGMPKAIIQHLSGRPAADAALKQKYFVEGLGRSVTGTTLAGFGWAMARAGLAYGLPPASERERNNRKARGIPNNSVMLNGKYVTLDRLAPMSNIFLMGVSAAEEFERQPTLAGKLGGTSFAVAKTFREQPFVKGLSTLGTAIENPERSGAHFIEQLGASVIPSLVAGVARGTVSQQARPEGFGQVLASRIPGARGRLPHVVDVRGRVVPAPKGLGASLFSPVSARPADRSAVAQGLASSGYGPSMPEPGLRRRGIPPVTLAGKEREQFEIESGKALEAAIAEVVAQPEFRNADPDVQVEMMKRAADRARGAVRKQWVNRKLAPSGAGGTR